MSEGRERPLMEGNFSYPILENWDLKILDSDHIQKNKFQFQTMKFTAKSNNEKDFLSKGRLIPYAIKCVITIKIHIQVINTNERVISYSKCSNWRQISKLSLNFGCLFTFCYLDGANSIKTDLHICNLWTGQFVSYKSVIQF